MRQLTRLFLCVYILAGRSGLRYSTAIFNGAVIRRSTAPAIKVSKASINGGNIAIAFGRDLHPFPVFPVTQPTPPYQLLYLFSLASLATGH